MDNGSAHRGPKAIQRLQTRYPNLVLVHRPIHASWLNQIEIYFSIVQRKVLKPNDFTSLTDLSERLLAFERHYQTIAQPFEWRFTRNDLAALLRYYASWAAPLPMPLKLKEYVSEHMKWQYQAAEDERTRPREEHPEQWLWNDNSRPDLTSRHRKWWF